MSHSHDFLTQNILEALSPAEQVVWAAARERLVREYCWYPDWYYSPDADQRNAARPYVLLTDDVPFHYLPANPIEYNNWRVAENGRLQRLANMPNLHWIHFSRGSTQTLIAVLEKLKRAEVDDAAKYFGVMLHVIEDAGSPAHVLEGFDGVDVFALDRLLRPPGDDPALAVGAILTRPDNVEFDWNDRHQRLLGTNVAEIVFHLYARLCEMIRENRYELIPIIERTWANDEREARARVAIMNRRMCELGADLMHTVTCIAQRKFEQQELESLACVHLEQMQPIFRPYFLPDYGASPIVKNANLSAGKRVPLQLRFDEKTMGYDRGMGTGCHAEYLLAYDLPANVYEEFRAAVGLHAELGRQGAIEVEIRLAGRTCFQEHFDDGHPAALVNVPVSAGGLLELYVRDETGDWKNPHNHVVWGEPRLIRGSGR